MSLCQPLSPFGSFILNWSQSKCDNIDIEGKVGQAKLSGSGKGRGWLSRLPRSCLTGKAIEEGHKTIESRIFQLAVRMCTYLVLIFSLGFKIFSNRQ